MESYRVAIQKAKKWGKIRQKVRSLQDPSLVDGKSTDIIIPVMGPTGVGKSTFINTLCGSERAQVGHDLESCTSLLQPIVIVIPNGPFRGRRLILVDTPGFDDTFVEDSEILYRIAHWLASSYDADMKLAGVVYLYDISQTRMLGTTRKNLEMFRKLCGDDALKSVILATTKWGKIDNQTGEQRESQLRQKFWKEMIENGSSMCRYFRTNASAWEMLHTILQERFDSTVLQIQKEVVDNEKLIPDTDAGMHLRELLEKALEIQKRRVNSDDNPQLAEAAENELRQVMNSLKVLKVPLARRLLIFFGVA